jgi:hypothetical protein
LKLARFYRDGELSDIKVSGADDTVFEVKNLFASEILSEDAIQDMIRTKNCGQMSHVDELRLDFDRICRKKDIQQLTRWGFYRLKDSSLYSKKFCTQTILNIKNEQRYLSACFSDYVMLVPRFGETVLDEPYLFASLKNGHYYLLNATELPPVCPPLNSIKNAFAWIQKKIFSKTSSK